MAPKGRGPITPRTDAAEYRELLKRATLELKRPQRVVESMVDASVDALNAHQSEADLSREAMTDHVFRVLCGNDTRLAFAPEHELPAMFLLVRRRAGASLDLETSELNLLLRIGALNQLIRDDAWQTLRWSKKRVLAPLARSTTDLKDVRAGLKRALGTGGTVRALKQWIAVNHGRRALAESDAAQAGPTLATGRKIVRQTAPLSDPEQRAVMVRRVAEADDEVRETLLEQYRRLARDVAEFVREVEEYEKE